MLRRAEVMPSELGGSPKYFIFISEQIFICPALSKTHHISGNNSSSLKPSIPADSNRSIHHVSHSSQNVCQSSSDLASRFQSVISTQADSNIRTSQAAVIDQLQQNQMVASLFSCATTVLQHVKTARFLRFSPNPACRTRVRSPSPDEPCYTSHTKTLTSLSDKDPQRPCSTLLKLPAPAAIIKRRFAPQMTN